MYPSPPIRHDPSIGRFIQADSIVPAPGNPQSLNRYAYVYNNPLRYVDPSGHGVHDVVIGAAFQYVNDVTLGLAGGIYYAVHGLSVDQNTNPDFLLGRECGRAVSQAQSRVQLVAGAAMVAAGLSAGPPTASVAVAAAVPTGGISLVAGPTVLTAEGVVVVGGVAVAAHGAAMMAFAEPIPQRFTKGSFAANLRDLTNKTRSDTAKMHAHHVFPQKFEKDFAELGINIHDPRYGSWVEAHRHLSFGHAYNLRWERFLRTPRSVPEIMEFGRQLGREYGFHIHY